MARVSATPPLPSAPGEVADLTEHDVGGDAREEAEHDRERDEARVATEPEESGGHHQYAGEQGEDDERLLPLRRAEALQRRARGQRRCAGRRDHHEAGVGGQPAEDRPGEARVEAVHGVHPDEHRSRHAVGDAAHRTRHAGDRVPGEVLARDRQRPDPGLEGRDDGRQPATERRRVAALRAPLTTCSSEKASRGDLAQHLLDRRVELLARHGVEAGAPPHELTEQGVAERQRAQAGDHDAGIVAAGRRAWRGARPRCARRVRPWSGSRPGTRAARRRARRARGRRRTPSRPPWPGRAGRVAAHVCHLRQIGRDGALRLLHRGAHQVLLASEVAVHEAGVRHRRARRSPAR